MSNDSPYPERITKEAVNALPLKRFRGPIELVRTQEQLLQAVEALKGEAVLGFDTETRPAFRKGESYRPALLQLGGDASTYLFQLLQLDNLDPLLALLSDETVLKVGVALHDDVRKLQEHQPFEARGFVDVTTLTKDTGVQHTGLRNLVAIFLGFRISKNAQVSNWAREELTQAQIVYAATDAWVSRELYLRLVELGLGQAAVEASV